MSNLNDLAARVEALMGPDREVDLEITRAVGRIPEDAAYEGTAKIGDVAWSNGLGYSVPAFTASIDDAATLVPEDYTYTTGTGTKASHAQIIYQWAKRPSIYAVAATPALALTAAALRSRVQGEG